MNRNHNMNIEQIYRDRLLPKSPDLPDNNIPLRYILEYLPDSKESRLLDAGCGNGRYSFYLADLGYTNISAIDLFPSLDSQDRFDYHRASLDETPFAANSFDFIFCNSAIYYLNDPLSGIREFRRILKADGLLVLSAHTKYSIYTVLRKIRLACKSNAVRHLQGVKFDRSTNTYRSMLLACGFQVIYLGGWSHPFRPLLKLNQIVKHRFHRDLYVPKANVTKNKMLKYLKSHFAYHSLIVAKKLESP